MAINVANSAADLEDAVILTAADVQDIEGLKTFMRAPAPPFGVEPGSAAVTNLDADKLDGQEGAFYRDASNLNAGTIPGDRLPDPLPSASGQNLSNLSADALVAGIVKVPTFTTLGNTDVGAQNNWAPGIVGNTVIFWNGASDIAITGFAGGMAGLQVTLKNITAAKIATFAHDSGSSSAGNKLKNIATSWLTPVAPGGSATYQYDGTDWQLIAHEQGAWITPAFAAGNYTGVGGGSWTVGAGDVTANANGYRLTGRTLEIMWTLATTTVAGTVGNLSIGNGAWGGFTAAKATTVTHSYSDNGAAEVLGSASVVAGGAALLINRLAGANWSAATDATATKGQIRIEVQ